MATQLKLEAPWDEVKEKVKENSIDLTDEDLVYEPGKEDELLNRLAAKMNRTPQQIKILIESISSNKGKAS
ncbi:MAG: general stress protein CsbD [Bacteroidota bacterium]